MLNLTREMARDSKSGQMVPFTRATGRTTKPMDTVGSSTLMGMFIRASGRTTRLMATAPTCTPMGPATRVNGKRTNSTERGRRPGQMVLSTKEIM